MKSGHLQKNGFNWKELLKSSQTKKYKYMFSVICESTL